MLRTFNEHYIRSVRSLDGMWDLLLEENPKERGDNPGAARPLPEPDAYDRMCLVPSAWETLPGLENYRGHGWMRRRFRIGNAGGKSHGERGSGGGSNSAADSNAGGSGAIRLVFGGVVHTAIVYVDGQRVGGHYDGFVPWDVVVTGLEEGDHELVLEIDNTFGDHSALHVPGDHYSSGGIIRPVELQEIPDVFIERIFATPRISGGKSNEAWDLDVKVRMRNIGGIGAVRRPVVKVRGRTLDLGPLAVEPDAVAEVSGALRDLEVETWSAESPVLYELEALLFEESKGGYGTERDRDARRGDGGSATATGGGGGSGPSDDLIDRVGFRQISIDGTDLLLNGEPIKLRGYDRHEYHAQFGQALPVEVMAGDVQLLKDLGCNFIRTSHYPNDMRFLDLCDEAGIYIWEETNSTSVDFNHPEHVPQITASATGMVEWHFNHPSIIIWATLNECDAKTKEGREGHARALNLLRTLDGSRPVTYASAAWKEDICLDLPDIVSWNWYEGWYWGSFETIAPVMEEYLAWQDGESEGRGKPVIISEFGAGAFYGYRSRSRVKWTEEYQADALDELLRVYLNHPRIAGAAIWQFCDVRISGQEDWAPRPRCMNNKGTVDELRRPKMAYDVVKARMHEARERFGR